MAFERHDHAVMIAKALTDCKVVFWDIEHLNTLATSCSPSVSAYWRNLALCQVGGTGNRGGCWRGYIAHVHVCGGKCRVCTCGGGGGWGSPPRVHGDQRATKAKASDRRLCAPCCSLVSCADASPSWPAC